MSGAHVPVLGAVEGAPEFPAQFKQYTIDARSVAVTPIEYFGEFDIKLNQHATGFFYRHNRLIYLVSARHAISGLDAFNDTCISPTGYLPKKIGVFPSIRTSAAVCDTPSSPLYVQVRDDSDAELWLQDPEFATLRTDIACIKLEVDDPDEIVCINEAPDEELFVNVGSDCFVVGFPSPTYASPFFPIWRRGVLASEPWAPVDGKPIFLVDGITSQGMSGSPIFQRWHGPAPVFMGSELTVKLDAIVSTRFVGVYGGRLGNKAEMGQVGYGWYANRLPFILAASSSALDQNEGTPA